MSPNYVFVIDKEKTPLTPTHPAKARLLLNEGRDYILLTLVPNCSSKLVLVLWELTKKVSNFKPLSN